ncbi:MAG TPA: hypothetical protein VF622_00075 [Segetibacter sp.]|jgi:hypothetical protein
MKKTVVLVFLVFSISFCTSFAQSSSTSINKKQPTLSVHFILNDYRTAQMIKNSSLSEVLIKDDISKFTEMSPGLSIAYFKGISDHVDFMATFGGSFAKYEFKNGRSERSEKLLLEVDANVNVKLLPDNYRVTPYVTAGVGTSLYGAHYGAYIPLGLGLQFRLGEDAFLFTNMQYRTGITEFTNNHFNYSIGFGAPLGAK